MMKDLEVAHRLSEDMRVSTSDYAIRMEPRICWKACSVLFGVVGRLRKKKGLGSTHTCSFKPGWDTMSWSRHMREAFAACEGLMKGALHAF